MGVKIGEKIVTLKRTLIKLNKCDANTGFAVIAELKRLEKILKGQSMAAGLQTQVYMQDLKKFGISCAFPMGEQMLKDAMMRSLPSSIPTWVGYGIKVAYVSKQKRGLKIEFRYKNSKVEVWKIIEG